MNELSRPRWLRTALMMAAMLLMAWLLWSSVGVLIPFIMGLVLAYVLLPLISLIERSLPFATSRPRAARTFSIIIVYLGLIGGFAVVLLSFVPMAAHQISLFIDELPQLLDQSQATFDLWLGQYRATVPADIQQRIDEEINKSLLALGVVVQGALLQTIRIVTETFGLLVAIVSVPVWLFYVLKDHGSLANGFYSFFPQGIRQDVIAVVHRIDKVLSAYIRAQLILAVSVGVAIWIPLLVIDVRFALVLGIIAGITEMIPVIGPIIGSLPAILVALATAPEKTLPVILLAVGVQFLENNVLVPRIHSKAVNIHPAIIMVLLVIASNMAGVWGMLVAVPLAAACREIYNYLHERLGEPEISVHER
ncbi:MAG: AI-2E family transporter [Dehalococcoidia bacterium]|nr:AI-2E family transporter [Dehalococcoidia bacterium]